MGEMTDKIKGSANKATGRTKRVVGNATDRPDIRAEGDVQEAKGGLQKAKGSVKRILGDRI
jgi:uncharacterized protein YjbJ (UPF0337 family)